MEGNTARMLADLNIVSVRILQYGEVGAYPIMVLTGKSNRARLESAIAILVKCAVWNNTAHPSQFIT